jgi:putative ABC transport system ATP-binding protein
MDNNQTVVQTRNLRKSYASGSLEVRALRGVDLCIARQEMVAIVGPSGSGKTTLLNLVAGLDVPDSGEVHLAGRPLSRMSSAALAAFRRDHVGFVFQAHNLIPVLTVSENAEYVLMLQGVSTGERRRRIAETLASVGLEGMENRFPAQLSGGQQQRVAIARALVPQPDIIIADEPTASLDSVTAADLINLMHRLNRDQGATFIISTHDARVFDTMQRVIHIQDGVIVTDERREIAHGPTPGG